MEIVWEWKINHTFSMNAPKGMGGFSQDSWRTYPLEKIFKNSRTDEARMHVTPELEAELEAELNAKPVEKAVDKVLDGIDDEELREQLIKTIDNAPCDSWDSSYSHKLADELLRLFIITPRS